jgi:hypothetical protein
MGLTFSDCAKVSRGGHNRKKDIAKEDRVLHTLTCELLRKRFDVTLPDTWAAQTCFIRDNADGQKALSLAKKMIKEELKNK